MPLFTLDFDSKKLPICFLVIFFLCRAGFAESNQSLMDLSIEELMEVKITSASKYEQKLSEAPSSVSIITSDQIRSFGYRTLAELLAGERGFFFTNDRNYTNVGIRGFSRPGDYNSRILLLLNGHRLNDNLYYHSPLANDAILDVDLIDRVEIVRGPSSSLYGTNAFFAVINIIPKTGKQLKTLEVSLGAGSQNSLTSRATHGASFHNGQELLISLTKSGNSGERNLYFPEFDNPDTNNGIARNQDGEDFHTGFLNYTTGPFTFHVAFNKREKNIPTASFDSLFGVSSERTTDQNLFFDLRFHSLSQATNRFDGHIFFDRTEYRGTYPYEEGLFEDCAMGKRIGGDLQYTKTWSSKRKTIMGIEFNDNTQQDQNIKLAERQLLNDQRSSNTKSVFLQEERSFSEKCRFNIGVRHDIHDSSGGSTNPRFACIYTFSSRTVGKLMFGQAFRVPNVFERFYADGDTTQKANLSLEPEQIKTWELSFDHQFINNTKATLSAYRYAISGLISQITDPADELLTFKNGGKTQAQGIELEFNRKWNRDLTARLAMAVQSTKDEETGVTLSNSPNVLGNLRITYPLFSGSALLGLEERYCGRRTTLNGSTIAGFFLTNLNLTTTSLAHGWSGSVGVYNLFDRSFADPGAEEHIQDQIVQNGRQFRIKLTKSF